MKKLYYSLMQNEETADINIYGDITSWPWMESDVSAYNLSQRLAEMKDVSKINVYINSYGGEVAEGLAIYNALKRHSAKVTTYCDGFACSIASVIFMAGDDRVMSDASLLMIHNAWTVAQGNAEELRKQAEDLEKITSASVAAYMAHSTISEEDVKALMDAESWLTPIDALEYGFATRVEYSTENDAVASQNARGAVFKALTGSNQPKHFELTEPKFEPAEEEEPAIPEEEIAVPEEEEKPTQEPATDNPYAKYMVGLIQFMDK